MHADAIGNAGCMANAEIRIPALCGHISDLDKLYSRHLFSVLCVETYRSCRRIKNISISSHITMSNTVCCVIRSVRLDQRNVRGWFRGICCHDPLIALHRIFHDLYTRAEKA